MKNMEKQRLNVTIADILAKWNPIGVPDYIADEEYKDYLLSKLEKILVLYNRNNTDDELEYISKELDQLKEKDDDNFTLRAVGHSHLDLAWLWPIRETKRKTARTIASLFYFLDKYPNYIFGISQPQQLVWLKEDYQNLFYKLKTKRL